MDREVILLVGLPGAGKTHWAAAHSKKYLKKFYQTIGAASILNKMKVCTKLAIFRLNIFHDSFFFT